MIWTCYKTLEKVNHTSPKLTNPEKEPSLSGRRHQGVQSFMADCNLAFKLVADCKMIVRVVIIRQAKIFMYLLKII
jgi:hypothetical protein